MKIATIIVRTLLGLMFVVFGANILHPFMPMPKMEGLALEFMHALSASHYIYVIGALQFVGGLLFLTGQFVAFGLLLLGPVVVNILCYHAFIDPKGLPMALGVSAMSLFLLYVYRDAFKGVLGR